MRTPVTFPKLSIVTPSRNQAAFIRRTVDSVLSQDYPNIEYIIVDDSTDETPQILAEYKSRLSRLVTGLNQGFGGALHHGFSASTGEIMGWINSDDFYLPDAFQTVARVFHDCPSVEWLTGFSVLCDVEGRPYTVNNPPGFSRKLFFSGRYLGGHKAWNGRWIPQESVFWRRSLWEKAGAHFFADRHFQYGDFELWSRFWQHAELHVVPVPVAAYRNHSNSYTAIHGSESTAPCTALIERAPGPRLTPFQIRWRSLLCRTSDRMARLFGEPAHIVEFDLAERQWHAGTRFVM